MCSQPDREPSQASSEIEVPISAPADGVNVPVPSESDSDGLWTLADDSEGHLMVAADEHIAWRMEMTVSDKDIEAWRKEEDTSDLLFLAEASKKQKTEVKITDLQPDEREMFEQAKSSEIGNWIKQSRGAHSSISTLRAADLALSMDSDVETVRSHGGHRPLPAM